MDHSILDEDLLQQKEEIADIYNDLHKLTHDVGNETLQETVDNIRSKLSEPFLFVIVGEVKVGKSSFVNALLDTGKMVSAVAPNPCTDTIQQIVYGEQEEEVEINPYLKKIYQPVEILKKISIVDTPGTNTIVEHHQEITESFIPNSDLIVFVFEAKNPYRQSAWDFFNYISQEWRKKIIFVLQQKDLMEPDDLVINTKGVYDLAVEKKIENPNVFPVSAKMELEDKPDSGFQAMRDYIVDNITGGNSYKLKLQSSLSTAEQIADNVDTAVGTRKAQFEADQEFRKEIDSSLRLQADKSANRVDDLVVSLLNEYDDVTQQTRDEFEEGLGVGTLIKRGFKSMFGSDESLKVWMDDLSKRLEENLKSRFESKMQNGVEDIADSIRQMAKIVELKIKTNETILDVNNEIFGDIAEKRINTLSQLQGNFDEFVGNTENFLAKELFPQTSSIAPDVAMGGGLAVIGAILLGVTHGVVLDVTGGILTGVGLLFASFTILFKKRGILREFDQAIAEGRSRLEREIKEKLKAYIENIKNKLDRNFDPFDNHIEKEMADITAVEGSLSNLRSRFKTAAKNLA